MLDQDKSQWKAEDRVAITKESLSTFKEAPKPKQRFGRTAGFQHLKPLNMDDHLVKMDCGTLMVDYPFIRNLKLVSNPYMYASLGHANYKTNTVELSEKKLLSEPIAIQREVFIRAVAHFIAKRYFEEHGEGAGYKAIVNRYLKKTKGQSNSTANVLPQHIREPEDA